MHSNIQAEIDILGQEISTKPSRQNAIGESREESSDGNFPPDVGSALESRVRSLERLLQKMSVEFHGRTSSIERDLESSLVVSEKRAKKLDELYREASAENEALYDRFNLELGKIAKDVRAGNGEQALKSHLEGALEEIGRLKKENFRLKREVGGLRAQQAAVALLKASE